MTGYLLCLAVGALLVAIIDHWRNGDDMPPIDESGVDCWVQVNQYECVPVTWDEAEAAEMHVMSAEAHAARERREDQWRAYLEFHEALCEGDE